MDIFRELREENLADVSRSTISRRLKEVGLIERAGVKKPLITAKNRKARLKFARKHEHWTEADWREVLFSDESKFQLFGSDDRTTIESTYDVRQVQDVT